jgi:hypothetical protein
MLHLLTLALIVPSFLKVVLYSLIFQIANIENARWFFDRFIWHHRCNTFIQPLILKYFCHFILDFVCDRAIAVKNNGYFLFELGLTYVLFIECWIHKFLSLRHRHRFNHLFFLPLIILVNFDNWRVQFICVFLLNCMLDLDYALFFCRFSWLLDNWIDFWRLSTVNQFLDPCRFLYWHFLISNF